MTWLRNAWYVAAWDSEVDRSPLARTICGVPTLPYRKFDGSLVAMRGDTVKCDYRPANPNLWLMGYNIDEGGVRSRQIISRKMKADVQ